MTRVKKAAGRRKRKKRLIKEAKGYNWDRSTKYRSAKQAVQRARQYAYRDRRTKKRDFRRLWQTKINAGARQHGLSYSQFRQGLKESGIGLDRKILAHLAEHEPTVFEQVAKKAKESLS